MAHARLASPLDVEGCAPTDEPPRGAAPRSSAPARGRGRCVVARRVMPVAHRAPRQPRISVSAEFQVRYHPSRWGCDHIRLMADPPTDHAKGVLRGCLSRAIKRAGPGARTVTFFRALRGSPRSFFVLCVFVFRSPSRALYASRSRHSFTTPSFIDFYCSHQDASFCVYHCVCRVRSPRHGPADLGHGMCHCLHNFG